MHDPTPVPFIKMQGIGNDYVYIDEREVAIADPGAWSRVLSPRRTGIGADGLIVLRRDPEFPCRMEMYNADGSRAEMCGNGIRCVAHLAFQRGYATERRFAVATDSGPLAVEILESTPRESQVRVGMGLPRILELESRLEVAGDPVDGTYLEVGNPHFVVEPPGSVADYPVDVVGPRIENHPRFPHRINAGFVTRRSRREIDLRVWERGSGETDACGTGATAAVAALHALGRVERDTLVHLRGGDLRIEIDDDGRAFMTGSATEVFRGTVIPPTGR